MKLNLLVYIVKTPVSCNTLLGHLLISDILCKQTVTLFFVQSHQIDIQSATLHNFIRPTFFIIGNIFPAVLTFSLTLLVIK